MPAHVRFFGGGGSGSGPTPTPGTFEFSIDTTLGSPTNTFTLPLSSAGTYNFDIDWGDSSSDTITVWNQAETTHTYSSGGSYNCVITGTLGAFRFANAGDKLKFTGVSKWGIFSNATEAFYGCTNFTSLTATDYPLYVVDFFRWFRGASGFNGDVTGWKIQLMGTTSLDQMFLSATSFNQDIGGWDVSSITKFINVFSGASAFNQDLSSWNVGANDGVFTNMFNNTSFNNGGSSGINNWNMTNATGLQSMFANSPFNQPIGSWSVSQVTNMTSMFQNNTSFNQNLNTWSTTNLTDIISMFNGASAYNQDMDNWDVSGCGSFQALFYDALAFNGNIDNWVTTSNTSLRLTFRNITNFNRNIDGWDTSGVDDAYETFRNCASFNQALNSWDVSSITDMSRMFFGCTVFNANITSWTPSIVTLFSGMFGSAAAFNQAIGSWDVSSGTDMNAMFRNTAFDQDITGWDTGEVTDMADMFEDGVFNQAIGSWDVRKCTTFNSFTLGNALFDQDLGAWKLFACIDMTSALGSLSDANCAACLEGWEANVPNSGVSAGLIFGGGRGLSIATYPNAKAAFDRLEATENIKSTGTNNVLNVNKLEDTTADFVTDLVAVGDYVRSLTSGLTAKVTAVDSATVLSLNADIFKGTGASYQVGYGYGWVFTGITWS